MRITIDRLFIEGRCLDLTTCEKCRSFYPIPKDADDYAEGKGDCVCENKDAKGKWWDSKPVLGEATADKCPNYVLKK